MDQSVTYRVVKKLYDASIISRASFLAFKSDYEVIVPGLEKKQLEDKTAFWDFVRSLFDFDDDVDCIPINAANLCPSFHAVQKCVNNLGIDMNRDVSIQNRISVYAEIIDDAHELVAKQLNISVNEIAFVRNATEANNIINNGLDFNAGDEIVLWTENHGTNKRAWEIRKERDIIWVDTTGAETKEEFIAKFLEKVTDKTRVVTFTEISNESGTRLPSKELIADIRGCTPQHVHVHVDGAQSWGATPLDLKDMDCDSFSASAHKWFCGPKEAGILYMKLALIPNFWPNNFGYDPKIILPDELYNDARRFETLGQRNDPTLMSLLYTTALMGLIGYRNIEQRIEELSLRLINGLQDMGYTLVTPTDPDLRHGVIIIYFENPDDGVALYNWLYTEHRIGVASTGGLRICPHIYNTEGHIDKVLAAIEEYRNQSVPPVAKTPAIRKK